MKLYIACALLLAVYTVNVLSKGCHHDDISHCTNMTCEAANEAIACQHDICTCNAKPTACLSVADCAKTTCEKHDEMGHCINSLCACAKNHPH